MPTISRIRVPWTGGVGGPGVSTFYAHDPGSALVAIRGLFAAFAGFVMSPISWQFPGTGDLIDVATGQTVGTWTATGQAVVVATGSGAYAGPAGVLVHWFTPNHLNGRRVRGRTFFVPVQSSTFDNTGTVDPTALINLQAAATAAAVQVNSNLIIYSRPQGATPMWTDVQGRVHAAKPARVGTHYDIDSALVPDKAVVLRSRRD